LFITTVQNLIMQPGGSVARYGFRFHADSKFEFENDGLTLVVTT